MGGQRTSSQKLEMSASSISNSESDLSLTLQPSLWFPNMVCGHVRGMAKKVPSETSVGCVGFSERLLLNEILETSTAKEERVEFLR